jgi:cold shock CspA family protein
MKGKVTSWKDGASFGLVMPEGTRDRVFIHENQLPENIRHSNERRDLLLEFDTEQSGKPWPNAVNVTVLNKG